MNGKVAIPPAIPSLSSSAHVNGNTSVNLPMGQNDHSRKPSVTISAAGASGYMPNGGQVVGKTGGNGIQFGSIPINANASPISSHSVPLVNQPTSSLAVSSPSNPRITSPQTSPSPIPQPPASGGKPPSSLQGQGNGLSFGSLGGEDPSVRCSLLLLSDDKLTFSQRQLRSMPSGNLTPAMQASHLRRESSQSGHGEMSGIGMATGPGRGNYNQQGGRGRGHDPRYPPSMPYSPGPPNFRPVPNQPRGGQNMGAQFQNQGRPLAYPHSPQHATRSPALTPSQPMHPQSGQIPMPSPQMQHRPYNNYAHQMGPPQVKPHSPSVSSSVSLHKHQTSEKRKTDPPTLPFYNQFPTPNLAPDSGQFEQYLIMRNQSQYGMTQGYDPNYGYYQQAYMHPGMSYMSPPSPQPGSYVPQGAQQQYQVGQYAPQQPPSMSRTSSAISERPASSVGQPQTPITPAVSQLATTPRGANSPAPKSTNFQIPSRKAIKVEIKDPSSGAVKIFDKSAASPAAPPASRSPAVLSSTPAPPPPPSTPSHADAHHVRTDSKSVRTDEEKKNDMRDAIAKKIEADRVEEKRQKEEAEAKALKEKEEAEAKLLKEREEAEAKQREEAAAQMAAEEAAKKAEAEAKAAEALAKEEAEKAEKARREQEEEEEMIRIEEEMERAEREAEERYQKKKQAEKEEKARLEAEAAARADEEMKKAEREAEEAEEARLQMLEASEPKESKQERAKLFASLKKEDPPIQPTSSPAAVDTPAPSGTATPVSDTSSMGPPPRLASASKQKPAALKLETSKSVEAPQPSAALQSLRSARFLTSVDDVSYPPSIASPNPALNTAAPMGKFRYDKNFLIQFQTVFTEKPSETWTEKVKETVGDTSETSARPSSARMPSMMGPRQPSNRPGIPPAFNMGAFTGPPGRTLPPGTTSTDRYQASLQKPPMQTPIRYFPNTPAFGMGSNSQSISRNPSSTGHPQSPRQNQSNRGTGPRGSKGGKGPRENDKDAKNMPFTHGQDIKPILPSATGWKPPSLGANAGMAGPPPGGDGYLAPDIVQRKVKAALNKMTPNNFDKISTQILDIVSQSKQETDGRTLRQVIQLTFEKATDEAHWAAMYAEFCGRMLEYMTPEIKDETLALDKNGNVTAGGTLFRKYLLNRCQDDFEQGWKTKLPEKPEGETEEAAMLSDEYYIAAAAKRRGLGLVRFIGELFKLGMLTSRIMHMCVKKLVDFEGMPDEAEVESLTSLLKTIGANLDTEEKGHTMMDAYFQRIDTMINFEGLPSRLRFMLMVS